RDWSSDVCSSDLRRLLRVRRPVADAVAGFRRRIGRPPPHRGVLHDPRRTIHTGAAMIDDRIPDVTFAVLTVHPEPYAITPTLSAQVGIATTGELPVHAIALRAQVRIDPVRRGYSDAEAEGLTDLFGSRERWAATQHTFLWQHTATMVPGFTAATRIDLPLVCTYDFDVAASKYLHALRDGAVPLQFLFSGTV